MNRHGFNVIALILLSVFIFTQVAFSEQEWLPGYGDKNGTLGKKEQSWRMGFINTLCMEGATSDAFETCIIAVDPTGTNVIRFPDGSGILITNSGGEDMLNATLVNAILNGVTEMEGELDINDGIINDVGFIMFNLVDGIECEEGKMFWNDTDGTNNLGLKGSVVCLQIGQEMLVRGKNASGAGLTNGTPVRISGVTGNFPLWGMSNAADPSTAGSLGLLTENISNNQFGYITTFGLVRELDTTGTPVGEVWSNGDRIYVGNTSGELTNVAPTGSERKIFMGIIFNANANEGIIWVNPINVSYFNELSGPLLTNGSVVFINSSGMTVEDNANLFWDDSNNRLGIGNATPLKALDVTGDSQFRNTIGPAAGMKFHDHTSPLVITLDAGGAFVNVTGLTNGPATSGMTQNSTDGSITVTYGGFYLGTSGFSLQDPDGNSEEYNGDWAVNGAEQDCDWHRNISVQSSEGFAGTPCLMDLTAGDVVTFVVNSEGGDDAAFEALNWNLTR